MNPHRAGLIAAGAVLVSALAAACSSGSSYPAGTQSGATPPATKPGQAASTVFTYDTTAAVMVDGWDPATEYSDGNIAMSEMYETLTHYDPATKTIQPQLATS